MTTDWVHDDVASVGAQRTETASLGAMIVARHRLPAGFDAAPYYLGFPGRACQAQHWCYLVRGKLRYCFADGRESVFDAGDAFDLVPGHTCEALENSELIEFTSPHDHKRKRAHLAHAEAHRGTHREAVEEAPSGPIYRQGPNRPSAT